MKKLLLPITLLLVVMLTITSCTKTEECTMCGTYDGNIKTNDTLRVHVGSAINLDTTFTTMTSKAVISEIADIEDSLSLTVSLDLAGTSTDVTVTAFKSSDTKLVVTDAIYNYSGITDILVNGDVVVDGTKATANVIISPAPSTPSSIVISGNLTFTGSK